MKILQVIDTLNVGGAEKVFVDSCNILKENENDVKALILLPDKGILADDLKIPIILLNRTNKWSFYTMYRCSEILKEFDIVHCHLKHVYKYLAIVNLLFRFKKTKIVFQDHSSSKVGKIDTLIYKLLIKPRYYIGVSQSNLKWATEKLNIRVNAFLLENIVRKNNDNEFNKDKEYDCVLVSNIKPSKNNLFAVHLCKSIGSSLLLVGKNQNESYFNQLHNELTDQILVDSNVSDVQSVITKASIGLHVSSLETGPLVLIEYLAQGIPFLAYETGEVSKILKPHFPEFFIDNFNEDEWVSRLGKIMEMTIDRPKMDFIFNTYFGEKQYYDKIMTIYLCVSKD